MLPVIAAGIGAASNLIGGIFNSQAKDKDRAFAIQQDALNRAFQEKQFQAQLAQNKRNEEMQYEFAKSGLQWKVEDAKAAGLHPLAAIGGAGAAFSPGSVSVGGLPATSIPASGSMGAAVANMGQDISRAMIATQNQEARDQMFEHTVKEMQLQNMALRNEVLNSSIKRMQSGQVPPPMPAEGSRGNVLEYDKDTDVTPIFIHGRKIYQDRGISDAQRFEDRYGETVSDWIVGPYIAWRDFNANYGITDALQDRIEQGRMLREYRLNNPHAPKYRGAQPAGRR